MRNQAPTKLNQQVVTESYFFLINCTVLIFLFFLKPKLWKSDKYTLIFILFTGVWLYVIVAVVGLAALIIGLTVLAVIRWRRSKGENIHRWNKTKCSKKSCIFFILEAKISSIVLFFFQGRKRRWMNMLWVLNHVNVNTVVNSWQVSLALQWKQVNSTNWCTSCQMILWVDAKECILKECFNIFGNMWS